MTGPPDEDGAEVVDGDAEPTPRAEPAEAVGAAGSGGSDEAVGDEAGDGTGDDAEDEHTERDPFKRRVAITLAALAVVGAWIGILRIDSANNESTFARETTRTAVSSERANVNQSTVAGLGVDLDAEQEALGLAAPFRGGTAGEQEALAQANAGIDAQDRENLERELTNEAARLDLQRAALAETRVTYNNRTSQYETVLTTLAVALFLVGFTLVLHRRIRPPVLVPGLLLAAYVAGWAIWIHQRPIPTTEPAAIEATAEAFTFQSFGEFDRAAESYTDAIEIDDDFASAYTGRSAAAFVAANPDFNRNLSVVDTDGELVQLARADAEEAIDLGEDNDFTSLLVSAVYRFYGGDYDGAVDRLEAAIEVNDRAPEALLLLSAAELARGELGAAERALDDGVALLDLAEASTANRQFAADEFTLLEQVEAAVPERADDVDDLRKELARGETELVFGTELAEDATAAGTFTLERSDFADDELDVSIAYEGLAEGSLVSIFVYEQPAEGAPFVQDPDLARFSPLDGSGEIAGTPVLERACRPVAFRYDIYVDGVFVESLDAPGGQATC